jgi:hypothetical protein
MIHQSPFTFLAEINLDKKDALRSTLNHINQNLTDNSILNFTKISSVHFARLLIIDEVIENSQIKFPSYLVVSTNYDGPIQEHLTEVLQALDFVAIFGSCKNSPAVGASIEQQLNFLIKHSNYKAYFYRGTWGRSVAQIHFEEKARYVTESFLDQNQDLHKRIPIQIKNDIVKNLVGTGHSKQFPKIKRPSLEQKWKIILASIVGIILLPVLIGLVLPFVLIFLFILRKHEEKDAIQEEKYSDLSETAELKADEDKIVQNQLTHLVEIKPGWFRLFTLKFVLNAIYFLAKNHYNKGRLGNIATIHFARWIIIDQGKRLLFFSNYDGSWESYLSDFVDRAAVGLTAVWSNTKGFPKSRFLVNEGAKDEQRFKSWTRRNQIHTNVWYSAYKDLTVKNINNNTEINEALFKDLNNEELIAFLRRY